MRKSMFIIPFIVSAACAVGFLAYSPSASAALDGENGRILYTDVQNQTDPNNISSNVLNGQIEESAISVITTAPDGSGDVVAATSTNSVETATISAPDVNGNSTIVYSEQAQCTLDPNPCDTSDPNELSQVSISKVTIDKNGNPITTPEKVATFDPLFESGVSAKNSISELSISPDGKNVLVTRTSYPTEYNQSLWNSSTGDTPVIFTENSPLELGVKFESSIDGYITGANIYVPECSIYDSEGFPNTSCGVAGYTNYDVNLWTKNGVLLSSVADYYVTTYYGYSGWQYIPFDTPVDINANKTYVISYSPENQRYAATNNYFTSKYVNGTLTALKSKADSGNGVYTYNPNSFPTETYEASNYWIDPIFMLYPLTTIENVNLETGEVTTIVAPRIDRLVAGGYAQNGNIYYSRTNSKNGSINDNQANIWVIEAGQTEAVKLTHSPNISEFYIDASPDNSVLLVANVLSGTPVLAKGFMGYCNYPQAKYQFYTDCDYFYVNTADGSHEKLKKLVEGFVPVFFSPDGNYLIGTLYPENYWGGGARLSEDMPVTAIVARSNLKVATKISDRLGVQEWAPLAVAQTTTTNPTVSTVVSGPTLPKTGTSELLVLAYATLLLAVASVVSIKSFANLKK